MSTPSHSVTLTRTGLGRYTALNSRGEHLHIGSGEDASFTPVELLLAAIAGCSSVDVDHMTSRRAEPETFEVTASGTKSTEGGNHMTGLSVEFTLRFPAGPEGDATRERVQAAIAASHERLCTVSRTIELGTPIEMRADVD